MPCRLGVSRIVWDEIRRQLGPEFSYGRGDWFCVPHEVVYRLDGHLFSAKAGGTGRRVVLATVHGPNARIFARSTSVEGRFSHAAHAHLSGPGRRSVDEDGWINLRIPVSVAAPSICDDTYSCKEPDETTLVSELARVVSL